MCIYLGLATCDVENKPKCSQMENEDFDIINNLGAHKVHAVYFMYIKLTKVMAKDRHIFAHVHGISRSLIYLLTRP